MYRGFVRQAGFRLRRIDHLTTHVTFALDQNLAQENFLLRPFSQLHALRIARQTCLGLRELFSHQTISDISLRIYDLTKDHSTPASTPVAPHLSQRNRSSTVISSSAAAAAAVAGAASSAVSGSAGDSKPQRFQAQGKKLVENLINAVVDDGTWTSLPDSLNIQIRTKKMEGTAISSVMGRGRVDAPARAILDCIMNLKDKKQWDTMFAEGRVVETYDDQTCIIYQAYDPVWPTSARDFCSLQYWAKQPDGSLVLASAESPHDQAPERQGCNIPLLPFSLFFFSLFRSLSFFLSLSFSLSFFLPFPFSLFID